MLYFCMFVRFFLFAQSSDANQSPSQANRYIYLHTYHMYINHFLSLSSQMIPICYSLSLCFLLLLLFSQSNVSLFLFIYM